MLFMRTTAFTQPCVYQAEKCGFTMISVYGIPSLNRPVLARQIITLARLKLSELVAAVNETPSIPPLQADQIPQVIFHCQDILGNITGNSYCINGCLSALTLTMDDQCAVGGNGTCPPGNGTITITSTSTTTTTTTTTTVSGSGGSVSCVRQCQTWCFGNNSNFIDPTQAPLAMPTLF